ncbi:MAG: hypothetical protein RSE41_00470 [Clostridia bacterium]
MSFYKTINETISAMHTKIKNELACKEYIDLEPKEIYVTMQGFICIAEKVIAISTDLHGNIMVETESSTTNLNKFSISDIALIADSL